MESTVLIPTNFYTATKTTKYSNKPKVADKKNAHILATVLPIGLKIGVVMHIGPLEGIGS